MCRLFPRYRTVRGTFSLEELCSYSVRDTLFWQLLSTPAAGFAQNGCQAKSTSYRLTEARSRITRPCGGNPLSGVTRPPGMSRGRVVTSHVTPP